jgi:hypothetical protein
MLFIFGIRTARIGKYMDNDHICFPCKAFEREILVYRAYFHFCLIPVFPVGRRQFEIRCKNCGDETRTESILRKYEKSVKTPFYLYSLIIFFAGLGIFWFFWNRHKAIERVELVGKPAVGDVYTISEGKGVETTYYFLRISGVKGDSVMALHSYLEYSSFVNGFAYDDYFVKNDTVGMSRKELRDMLEKGKIAWVTRGYGDGEGFGRIK